METKMSKKETNKKSLILGVTIIIIIGIIGTCRSNAVKQKGVYTIATIYNVTGARGGLKIHIRYSYKDLEYTDYAVGSEYTHEDKYKRLFIQVLPNDPERCKMTNIRVPDSITQAPYSGWKELPIPIPKE
jgi:hypothetical protein